LYQRRNIRCGEAARVESGQLRWNFAARLATSSLTGNHALAFFAEAVLFITDIPEVLILCASIAHLTPALENEL